MKVMKFSSYIFALSVGIMMSWSRFFIVAFEFGTLSEYFTDLSFRISEQIRYKIMVFYEEFN